MSGTPQNPDFTDPYANCAQTSRISADVDFNDFNDLRAVRPVKGTIQTTINIIFKKLINELQSRNIKDYGDRDAFEQFISGCRIISAQEYAAHFGGAQPVPSSPGYSSEQHGFLRPDRPTPPDHAPASTPRNVAGGTGQDSAEASTTPVLNSELPRGVKGRSRSTGGSAPAGATKKAPRKRSVSKGGTEA